MNYQRITITQRSHREDHETRHLLRRVRTFGLQQDDEDTNFCQGRFNGFAPLIRSKGTRELPLPPLK